MALISRIAGGFPYVYAVWHRRTTYIGMAVHMFLNGISTTATIVAVGSKLV